jgi:putative transposase
VKGRYRYRLRVNSTQASLLQQVFDADRFVWNQGLRRWNDLWRLEDRTGFSYGDAAAELTDWRGSYDWLAAQPQDPQQQTLRDLFHGVAAFFDRSNPAGRPAVKKKSSGYATARWTRNGFAIKDGRLEVATSTGRIALRVVWSRELPSRPGMVTVRRDAVGRWWASFTVDVEPAPIGATGRITGLDVGLSMFATAEHPDADIVNPRFARRAAKALARSQRNLAAKQKGSNNRAEAKKHLARVHAKVANQRADFQHKTARTLARRYDRIGVETLKVKNMSARGKRGHKKGLNRAISDAGWAAFVHTLEWHAAKAGHEVVVLPARNTTQQCSDCGTKAKPRMQLSDRMFRCPDPLCGLVLDRDRNAARNLNPGRSEPGGGVDGSKTRTPQGALAA